MDPSLRAFFDAIPAFLHREVNAEGLASQIGPSPSGAERMALYPWLVQIDLRAILGDVFPSVRAACERSDSTLWPRLTDAYEAAHPPRHWETTDYAKDFLALLERERQAGTLPSTLFEELADFHLTRLRAYLSTLPPGQQELGETVAVRMYSHAIRSYVDQVARGIDPPLPAARSEAIIIYRVVSTQLVDSMHATPALLVALARRLSPGEVSPTQLAAVAEADVAVADSILVQRGVFTPT